MVDEASEVGYCGDEMVGELVGMQAEHVVAEVFQVVFTPVLVEEGRFHLSVGALFFESTIDFHYEPIVDKQINAVIVVGFLEEKHHLGVHGYMRQLGNNQVAGVGLIHRINTIKRPVEDPLGAHHAPLAVVAGNVSLEIVQVIGVEGGFQERQALGLPMHGANIGERSGRGGHPIAVDDHDVFGQEVGAPVVNNAGPLAT